MGLSLVQSRALRGLDAARVTVEVHLANGLPSFTLVGLADVEVKEARERVRCAIQNAGLQFPHNQRIKCSQALFLRFVQRSRKIFFPLVHVELGRGGVCEKEGKLKTDKRRLFI